jgi:hypothetical protein
MHDARSEDGAGFRTQGRDDAGLEWLAEGEPLAPGQPRREPLPEVPDSRPRERVEPRPNESGPGDPPPSRGDTPAPVPGLEWCPKLPEEDPKPPPEHWNPDPCAPLSSEGRSEGGKWVPETPLLNDPAHPDHKLYEQALSHLQQPGLCDRFDSEAQRERVAAAIAAEAKEAGLKGIDHVVVGRQGGPFIAIEGPNPYAPEARRATVDYAEAIGRSVEQSTAKITPEACTFKPGEERLLSELAPPTVSTLSGGSPMLR